MSCVCAVGVFDGVHRGHRELVAAARADAQARGLPCVVVTFDPDPIEVVRGPEPLSRLLRTDDRVALLRSLGVDEVVCLPFTRELAATDWRAFAREQLVGKTGAVAVHVGSNFRFGRAGAGSVASLRALGAELGCDVREHELVEAGDETVSSTRIRRLLRAGEVTAAGELLGRAHLVRGRVAHGRGEGTQMGFPTANVEVDPLVCMPGEGVYAGWVVVDGRAWPAAVNVGAPVSFDERDRPSFLEANLLGFAGDLYGREVAVGFAAWLRAVRRFASVAELEQVVGDNIGWVREHLGSGGVELGPWGVWGLRAVAGPGREG